jgi:copper chaperone CopZ
LRKINQNQSKSIKINQNQSKSIKINHNQSKSEHMKNLILFLFLALSTSIFAQKPVVITIQTSAQCGDCKQRIETALNQTKGVVYAELNQETKAVEVKFKPSKTDAATIKTALTLVGYDADEMKANPVAQKALPLCCQPGGH